MTLSLTDESGVMHDAEKNRQSGEKEVVGVAERTKRGSGGTMNGVGAGGVLLDEEPHVYIAAMQLFPIKLNFSFIKNADVKVCS